MARQQHSPEEKSRLVLEAIRGKALSQEKESIITMVGVVFMLVLFVAVTWNDILRAFVN